MLILLSAITFSDKAGSFALFLSQNDRLRNLRKVQVGKFACFVPSNFQIKGHYPGSYVQIMSTSRKGAVFLDINYQLSRFLGSLPKTKKPSLVHKDD